MSVGPKFLVFKGEVGAQGSVFSRHFPYKRPTCGVLHGKDFEKSESSAPTSLFSPYLRVSVLMHKYGIHAAMRINVGAKFLVFAHHKSVMDALEQNLVCYFFALALLHLARDENHLM